MKQPGYMSHETATWVMIIRPDSSGSLDLIGNYAMTIPNQEVIPSNCTEVWILNEGPFKNQCFLIKEDSLCQSHMESVEWMDKYIV